MAKGKKAIFYPTVETEITPLGLSQFVILNEVKNLK